MTWLMTRPIALLCPANPLPIEFHCDPGVVVADIATPFVPLVPHSLTSPLMFNMLGAIAQFERELIRERMLAASPKPRPKANTGAEPRQHG
jgi:DNA invertase Pin-like site-specific DNA recombinase